MSFSDTLYVLCADGVCLPGIATLAQSVERLTRNEQVDSSILSSGSTALDVRRFSEHLGFCICASVRIGFRRARMVIARVAELVDAQDLGSCVFDVWVQVPSRALSENGGSLPVLGHRRPFNKLF